MKQTLILLSALFLTLFQAHAEIRYVTPNGAGAMDGSSWTNAYPGSSLQMAISISGMLDEVWVAQGIYHPTTGTNRNTALGMRDYVAIYGSFVGTETLLSERNISNGLTSILSGEIGAPGIFDNSYRVMSNLSMGPLAILDGFIIEGANDDRTPDLTVGNSSPCIDAGNLTGITSTDILSQTRVMYSGVDMGAYELDSLSTLTISENKQFPKELMLSPNPANDFLDLIYMVSEAESVYLEINDLNGNTIWTASTGEAIGVKEIQIDLRSFENGMYLLSLQTKSGKLTRRFIKNT